MLNSRARSRLANGEVPRDERARSLLQPHLKTEDAGPEKSRSATCHILQFDPFARSGYLQIAGPSAGAAGREFLLVQHSIGPHGVCASWSQSMTYTSSLNPILNPVLSWFITWISTVPI